MALTLVTGWTAALAVLWLGLLTLPRWFARSMHRHRLWRHRDQLVDRILGGRLPDHPAVWETLNDVERAIASTDRTSLARGLSAARAISQLPPAARGRWLERCQPSSMEDLPEEVQERIREFQRHTDLLTGGLVMLGSWVGVGTVLAFAVKRAVRRTADSPVSRKRGIEGRTRAVVAAATDEATVNTGVGRVALESASGLLSMEKPVLAS